MNICIIGTGFVGVVSSAVFASFGNTVIGLDIDQKKIEKLRRGVVPFYEPGLNELLIEQQEKGQLSFTDNYKTAISDADVIMIAVGTPSRSDGQADLAYVVAAAESAAPYFKPNAILAVKSTVPPGTLKMLREKIAPKTSVPFYLASLPEFLKEGSAVDDTLHPDRVVIGADDQYVFEKLEKLHEPLHAPIVKMSPESAQMAKYTANSYLATRITFINQIADLCEKNGADIQEVIQAIGYDKRIGKHYWYPGLSYGGSCFPKDVRELAAYSRSVGEENNLLNKINEVNEQRPWKLMDRFSQIIGGWDEKKVAVLGLSFKPNTDDLREAPSTKIIPHLLFYDVTIHGYDPKAIFTLPENQQSKKFQQVKTIDEATQGADVIVAVIEWPEVTTFDFSRVREKGKKQWFIDLRDQFSPEKVRSWGFEYIGIGRS